MYIHKSLNNKQFASDKKLNLLKNNIINISQFINLIQLDDPYTIIGPAIVAKNSIQQFIIEWKNSKLQLETNNSLTNTLKITQNDIIDKLQQFINIFPQIYSLVSQFKIKLETTKCQICEKNKYILLILSNIRQLYKDGRDLKNLKYFIQQLLFKYYPMSNKIITSDNLDTFDITWIKPDQYIALGDDLIKGLNACFDCAKKHLGRAKAFYQEWLQGYPQHNTLMYKEFTNSNEILERGYLLFWDSLAQLDMSSCELVGNMIQLDNLYKIEIIQLANQIRKSRILFQQDSSKVPDWNKLRIDIQKLQNKINKLQIGTKK